MELSTPLTALTSILEWLQNIRTGTIARNQRYKDAILAISTAANQTLAYIADSEKSTKDRRREVEISSLWDKATAELLEFDTDLASRCRIKAVYWADPSRWSQKQIAKTQIRLSAISKEIDRLIADFPK